MEGKGHSTITSRIRAGDSPALPKEVLDDLFLDAVIDGDRDLTKRLIELGADISRTDGQGWDPLMHAAAGGYEEIVDLLVNEGATYGEDALLRRGFEYLECFITGGIEKYVRKLVENSVPLAYSAPTSWSSLMTAVMYGHISIARYLIQQGADVNYMDDDNYTPLMVVPPELAVDFYELLINAGANVNSVNCFNENVLLTACSDYIDQTYPLLIDAGADIHIVNNKGRNALFLAAEGNAVDTFILLIEKGISIQQRDNEGYTVLMLLAKDGNTLLCSILIDAYRAELCREGDS